LIRGGLADRTADCHSQTHLRSQVVKLVAAEDVFGATAKLPSPVWRQWRRSNRTESDPSWICALPMFAVLIVRPSEPVRVVDWGVSLVAITRVQISSWALFPVLKTLGVTPLGLWIAPALSGPTGITASRYVVALLSELSAHMPAGINAAFFQSVFCCPTALPRDFKLLRVVMHSDQRRRGSKRVVQPSPQIAIEEQLLPQQRR